MDANRQETGGLGMTFADDNEGVKNFTFQRKGCKLSLTRRKGTHTGCSLFESLYCNGGVVHYRLCGQNGLKK